MNNDSHGVLDVVVFDHLILSLATQLQTIMGRLCYIIKHTNALLIFDQSLLYVEVERRCLQQNTYYTNVLACKYKLAYSVVLINNFFSANVPIYMGLRFGPKYNASDFVFSMLFHIFVHMYFGPQWLYYRKEKKNQYFVSIMYLQKEASLTEHVQDQLHDSRFRNFGVVCLALNGSPIHVSVIT